jgi:hypothetical protein
MKEGGLSSIFDAGIRPDQISFLIVLLHYCIDTQGRSGYSSFRKEAMSWIPP